MFLGIEHIYIGMICITPEIFWRGVELYEKKSCNFKIKLGLILDFLKWKYVFSI